jgi:hypothetical protein
VFQEDHNRLREQERLDIMAWKQTSSISDPTDHRLVVRSQLLVAPIAFAVLAFTVVGLSAPYLRFDLTTKIQTSLLH